MLTVPSRIESFRTILDSSPASIIALVGPTGVGKSTFLDSLIESGVLPRAETSICRSLDGFDQIDPREFQKRFFIFDLNVDDPHIESELEGMISKYTITARIIYTTTVTPTGAITLFHYDHLSFREYLETQGKSLTASELLAGQIQGADFDPEKMLYLQTGGHLSLLDGLSLEAIHESIGALWKEKLTEIRSRLFRSEYQLFDDFMKHLALGTGDLFKSDKMAKLLGVSRRKIDKYTNILEELDIIVALAPFCENTTTELSRDDKYYFCDLIWLSAILGPMYAFGTTKKSVLENFIFLELKRKVGLTHEIRFYRKKSGTDVSFLLVHRERNTLTPIDVTDRSVETIPPAMKAFDTQYHDRVDRFMLLDEHTTMQTVLSEKPFLILPHIGI